MNKKFELLLDDTITIFGIRLFRIKALISFGSVEEGEIGGYVEKEDNLSSSGNAWVSGNARIYGNAEVSGNAWVYGNALVSGNARIYGNAWVSGNALVSGNARIYGNARISGNARIYGNAWVSGNARIYGNAEVSGNADYIVFKNHWSSGRYFTYTKSNKMWRVGCFYGTGQELINKAYQDSEISGKHYEAYVEFVDKLEKLEEAND
ncbi:LbetaH domain-containing protein [Streptococcus gordonii]|uniref:Polymer-forming cytoskeletal protein n=1 Tax=Streptococcus gordonii TaxID=1302 RepID=A0AB35FSG8_STRGN|nr:polymer-forming cytoskeletal protein [Streptococcus gordonii]MBZ2127327.1 polymer-forming cytoskeletal protein [Streptococcus gordonii]MBZ2129394.1 polymer-forming cytoskeletal protein [Streptococcus gordonii]